MRELLLFQVTVLLGVSLALDLRHFGTQVPTINELQRNKRLASPTNLKANFFLLDDVDLRLSEKNRSPLTSQLLSKERPSSAGGLQLLTRSRRDAVDRVLSIFGGSIFSVSRPRHNSPNGWRPVHPRPHLGAIKHRGPPPHKGIHHIRGPKLHGSHPPKHHHGGGGGPHNQKHRGPPKHHNGGSHKHIDDHHIIHDDHQEHHHHFEEHHGDDIHHDDGPIHHDDSLIHHDDDPIHDHHHDGPIHHDSGPAHHDGSEAHYDDHSSNDIHDYPDHEYIVEYDDGGLVFGHHDTSFKPSLPVHKRPHHEPDYHHDPHHEPHFNPHSDDNDDEHVSNNPGHIASITQNNIYRDDVPFKEVMNDNDKIHDGLEPGGVKGLDPELLSFISDKTRPYVIGADF